MCKRNTRDPLVRLFLDRYNLNLLPIPRAGIACGDVYVRARGRVSTPFSLRSIVAPDLGEIEDEKDEPLGTLKGTLSEARDVRLSLGLLDGFLTAMGAAGLHGDLALAYERSAVRSLSLEFRDATLDSVDPGNLGDLLINRGLKERHPLIAKGNQYFVVTGVVRSAELTVHSSAATEGAPSLDLGALQVATANAGVSVRRDADTVVTYEGPRRLAIGVELYELGFDPDAGSFWLKTPKGPLMSHGALAEEPEPVFLGADGDAFLEIAA